MFVESFLEGEIERIEGHGTVHDGQEGMGEDDPEIEGAVGSGVFRVRENGGTDEVQDDKDKGKGRGRDHGLFVKLLSSGLDEEEPRDDQKAADPDDRLASGKDERSKIHHHLHAIMAQAAAKSRIITVPMIHAKRRFFFFNSCSVILQ